jgi:hypothetical protein
MPVMLESVSHHLASYKGVGVGVALPPTLTRPARGLLITSHYKTMTVPLVRHVQQDQHLCSVL